MSQTSLLLTTLKQALKQKGKTYADVAGALNLSEASIKRLFSHKQISLSRLEEICRFLEMDIADLVEEMTQKNTTLLESLSIEQEQEIVKDIRFLVVTVCVLSYWRYKEIKAVHHLEDKYLTAVLLQLDKIGLIDLLPENKIRLKVASNFAWQKQGPIIRFFKDNMGTLFFHKDFANTSEHFGVLNGMVSEASLEMITRKIRLLEQEFQQCVQDDSKIDFNKKKGVTLLMGFQKWKHGLLGQRDALL